MTDRIDVDSRQWNLRVSLEFRGGPHFGVELDPDALTRELGIVPSRSWRIGDELVRGFPARASGWALEAGAQADSGLEGQMLDLLKRLAPAWENCKSACSRYPARVEVVVEAASETSSPMIRLPKDVLFALADLGATVGFDIRVACPE